jgi:hypothetical protein
MNIQDLFAFVFAANKANRMLSFWAAAFFA